MFWTIFPPAALPTVADRRLRMVTPYGRLRSAHLYRHFIISTQTCGRIQTDIWRFQTVNDSIQTDSHGIQTDNLLWTFYATRYFFDTILLFVLYIIILVFNYYYFTTKEINLQSSLSFRSWRECTSSKTLICRMAV